MIAMNRWELLEALENAIMYTGEAMDAIKAIAPDDCAALEGVKYELMRKADKQRARVRELEEQDEAALRREYERGLLWE